MFIVDSHCHLDALDYENLHKDIADVVAKAQARDVKHLLAIGVTLSRFEKAYPELAKFPNVSLACGVHPLDLEEEPYDAERLLRLAQDKKVIAIGEIGLDYYWMEDPKEIQIDVFKRQIALSKEHNLPFVVHTRDALEDTYAVIKEVGVGPRGGIMHSYSGSLEMAQKFVDLGMMISFSGVVTFKKALDVQEAAQKLPLDKILVETDAPYLAPVPKRGRENRTGYTRYVVDKIAELRGLTSEEVARATYDNAMRIFGLDE